MTIPDESTFIRSAPGRGYSFVADVSEARQASALEPLSEVRAPIFVNRGPELAALADALDAVRASARRFVLISGEHGAGKSALCDAFVRTAHAGGPVRVCYGQSFDRELPHEPYYVFLDALIALDRRHPGYVPRVLAANAPSWLAQFPQWSGAGTPAVHAVRMFDELGAALAALSYDLPLILILEDLQWADADSVNALARLAESQIPSKLLIVGTCCDGEWTAGERAHERLLAVGGRVATFGDAAARLLDARARGAVRRRAVRPGVLVRTRPRRSSGDEWQSLHDGQRYRQPGGAPTGSPRRRPVAPRSLSRCHCQRVARDARRSDCAARRSSRPVGTRSARSGCGGRARVHGLGGRRRAPAESRIRQARAGSDGPPRAPARCCRGCRGCRGVGLSGPSARPGPSGRPDKRASHRPPTGSGMRSMPTSSRSRRQCFDSSGSSNASAASATSPTRRHPPSRLSSSPPYGVGTSLNMVHRGTGSFRAEPRTITHAVAGTTFLETALFLERIDDLPVLLHIREDPPALWGLVQATRELTDMRSAIVRPLPLGVSVVNDQAEARSGT